MTGDQEIFTPKLAPEKDHSQFYPVYASLTRRACALSIDFLIFNLVVYFSARCTQYAEIKDVFKNFWFGIPATFILLYAPLLEISKMQGSIGKLLLGMKVVKVNGSKIGLVRAFFRHLFKLFLFLASLGLSTVICVLSGRKMTVHDYLFQTVVIIKA